MAGERYLQIASEGLPFLGAAAAAGLAAWHYLGTLEALPFVGLVVVLLLVFRDPDRNVPAVPLGLIAPVDGRVVAVADTGADVDGEQGHCVTIRVDPFGTYSARSPAEGKVMDLAADGASLGCDLHANGLWVRTDEGQDVVLQFRGHRFGLPPVAFLGYGARVGQGQRCAYLRLTRYAEIRLPASARVLVEEGARVRAGCDQIGRLPHS